MSIEKKTCRDRRDSRATLSRLLPLLLIIVLLVPVQSLGATVQASSGAVQLVNVLTYGTTAYSVDYSHPTTAAVGTKLTIAFTLHVNSLSGAIQYISTYGIAVYVYIGAQVIGNGSS